MADICSLGLVTISDSPVIPANMRSLFSGPWASQAYGANVRLLGEDRDEPLPPFAAFFIVKQEGKEIGAVLVDDIDANNRRARVHVALFKEFRKLMLAYSALVLSAATLGDCFGIERMWTYVTDDSGGEGLAKKCGLSLEGRLEGHRLTSLGRDDVLIYGGLWPALRKLNKASIDLIEWSEPMARPQ